MRTKAIDKLEDILPDLYRSREVHIEWRDYLAKYPEQEKRHKSVGSSNFHGTYVLVYDDRIDAVESAIKELTKET